MKLSKRQDTFDNSRSENKKTEQKEVKVDWKLYIEDLDALIPYGKWINKTVGWVKKYEPDYYYWIKDNKLMGSWGLIKLRPKKEEKQKEERHEDHFIASDGSIWICLIEKPL